MNNPDKSKNINVQQWICVLISINKGNLIDKIMASNYVLPNNEICQLLNMYDD